MISAAIGFRMHSGWGAVVVVSKDGGLELLDRRHIIVADASIPGSKQPYHYAEKLELKEAEKHIARCSAGSLRLASGAIREMIAKLTSREYRVKGSAILMASGRALPSLEKILSSHALIHTAEGEFFRTIVRQACEDAGITILPLRERDLEEHVKKAFGNRAKQVRAQVSSFGKQVGPPWTQDEKLAALAAALILAS